MMVTFNSRDGLSIRDDGMPLQSKIVATIGAVADDDVAAHVRNFYENGVDVIRLNLSHVPEDEIQARFLPLKAAVLACQNGGRKPMAILADFPGPKIRFDDMQDVPVAIGEDFTILFDEADRADGQRVFVDSLPLVRALQNEDERHVRLDLVAEDATDRDFENFLGFQPAGFGGGRAVQAFHKAAAAAIGRRAIIGDNTVVMEVKNYDAENSKLTCTVLSSTTESLNKRKSFTLKGVDLDIPTFTETDERKLKKLLYCEYKESDGEPVIGMVALSFVQTAHDLLRARFFIEHELKRMSVDVGYCPAIIAKIETAKGVRHINHILDIADGIMVARGDLTLQLDVEQLPAIQKALIHLANQRGKPVITATEMLKSMVSSIEPTRAEGTDVFNAIVDGSDAIMLSEETAEGDFPLDAIRKMAQIAEQAEVYRWSRTDAIQQIAQDTVQYHRWDDIRKQGLRQWQIDLISDDYKRVRQDHSRLSLAKRVVSALLAYRTNHEARLEPEWRKAIYEEKFERSQLQDTTNRITDSACALSDAQNIRAIIAPTAIGRTARMISRLRPRVPIIGAAHDVVNMRKLLISYGVFPLCIKKIESNKNNAELLFDLIVAALPKSHYLTKLLPKGAKVIFTAGTPLQTPGMTNLVQIRDIP